MLALARAIGLDDTVNAANWQEFARWLLRSRLDSESRKELLAKEAEEDNGGPGVCVSVSVSVSVSVCSWL